MSLKICQIVQKSTKAVCRKWIHDSSESGRYSFTYLLFANGDEHDEQWSSL